MSNSIHRDLWVAEGSLPHLSAGSKQRGGLMDLLREGRHWHRVAANDSGGLCNSSEFSTISVPLSEK